MRDSNIKPCGALDASTAQSPQSYKAWRIRSTISGLCVATAMLLPILGLLIYGLVSGVSMQRLDSLIYIAVALSIGAVAHVRLLINLRRYHLDVFVEEQNWVRLIGNNHAAVIASICLGLVAIWFAQISVDGLESAANVLPVVTESTFTIGLDKQLTLNGQWWRLLTAPLAHTSIWHLLFNLLMLYLMGRCIEALFSWKALVSLFMGGAVAGAIVSCFTSPLTSAGASGAAYAFLGFLVVLVAGSRTVIPRSVHNALFAALVIAVISNWFQRESFDIGAHAGGLVFGVLYGIARQVINRSHGKAISKKNEILNTVLGVTSLLLFSVGAMLALALLLFHKTPVA